MTEAARLRASYRKAVTPPKGEWVTLRRREGTGPVATLPKFEAPARARVFVDIEARKLIADLKTGEQLVLVLAEDLINKKLWPIKSTDKIEVRQREFAQTIVENRTAPDGSPLALVLRFGGS